jgi:ubiquinone/menaquinone biosynthesis C-methylase UbiE
MNQTIDKVGRTLQTAYDEMYTDDISEWRELGGKHKAHNILSVCKGKTFPRVLECGAGEGSILKALDQFGPFQELYAVEISDSGIAQIRKRNIASLEEVKKFNGYEIPYPDEYFDMAYCSHVIEHVEHPRLLLRELSRVSKFQVFEIPLDYSIGADENVKQFLSYGHINMYTPTLFRFLLKSEGYEVLSERLTSTAPDVIRFNWYKNMGRNKSILNELKIFALPLRNALKKIIYGKRRYAEYGYSAYTCLAKCSGELKIF